MIFKIISAVILFIALITLMYNVIVGVRIKDDKGRVVRVYVSTRALRTMAKNGSIERA